MLRLTQKKEDNMRVLIWMLNSRFNDVLIALASIGFKRYVEWGKIEDPPGTTLIVGDVPDDKLDELKAIDAIEGWNNDFKYPPESSERKKIVIQRRELEVVIYPKRTTKEWAEAGAYNYYNLVLGVSDFNKFLTVKGVEPYKAKVVAFNLGFPATIDEAKRVRKRLKLLPIGFEHHAAVGEQHKDVQAELNCIINPDIVVCMDPDLEDYVPYLFYRDSDHRNFSLLHADREWEGSAWFLGLKE